jgi:hypothetical protein
VNLSHPFSVTGGKIIVDGNNVDAAPASQRVQIRRKRSDQGLTLSGSHFGDLALMQNYSAYQLHVEVAHACSSHTCFTNYRKCFWQNLVEYFSLDSFTILGISCIGNGALDLLFEGVGPLAELVIRKFLNRSLEAIDFLDNWSNRFQISLVTAAKYFC